MLQLFKRYRDLLFVSALLIFPFASFLATGHKGREPNVVDRAVLALASPLQRALAFLCDGIGYGVTHYVALTGVQKRNDELLLENSRLRAELNAMREKAAEADRLKRIVDYVEKSPEREVVARIIGVNPVSTFHSVRIDRGMDQGVHPLMPVVTPDGVVGYVKRATGGWADVVLVTDQTSKLGVVVQRTRSRGTAVGQGGARPLVLENVLRTENLEEGDVVVTAGSDGIFPKGLVVGRTSGIRRNAVGMFLQASIVPSVDLEKLEEVLVLPYSTGVAWAPAAEGLR